MTLLASLDQDKSHDGDGRQAPLLLPSFTLLISSDFEVAFFSISSSFYRHDVVQDYLRARVRLLGGRRAHSPEAKRLHLCQYVSSSASETPRCLTASLWETAGNYYSASKVNAAIDQANNGGGSSYPHQCKPQVCRSLAALADPFAASRQRLRGLHRLCLLWVDVL